MEPEAYVTEVDGKLVLVDPMACAMIDAITQHNKSLCRSTLELQLDRAKHFARRVRELGRRPSEVVIVLLNVDDPQGGAVADILMPGHDWQQFRDRGEVPFARGLAGREGLQGILDELDPLEGQKLREAWMVNTVVVMDHGAVEVFKEGEDF
ncbi:hypothetical protein M0R72_01410 [Candidatus Pacearchaeota archaeon]|jgi:hypothetical protein|nr:hypothetical protein [Candidatus Pacearchaeota archaeon]